MWSERIEADFVIDAGCRHGLNWVFNVAELSETKEYSKGRTSDRVN